MTKRSSFQRVQEWLQEARVHGHANINFLLIGNKCDMTSEREVLHKEGQDYAFAEGFNYIETSAKIGHNIEQAFLEMSFRVVERIQRGLIVVDADGSNGVKSGNQLNQTSKTAVSLSQSQVGKDATPKDSNCCGE